MPSCITFMYEEIHADLVMLSLFSVIRIITCVVHQTFTILPEILRFLMDKYLNGFVIDSGEIVSRPSLIEGFYLDRKGKQSHYTLCCVV